MGFRLAALLTLAVSGSARAAPIAASSARALQAESRGPVQVLDDATHARPSMLAGRFAAPGGDAEAAARTFLSSHADAFHLDAPHDWPLIATRQGRAGTYLRFGQISKGVRVFWGQVVVLVAGDTGTFEVRAVGLYQRDAAGEALRLGNIGGPAAQALALRAVDAQPPFRVAPATAFGIWAEGAPRFAYRVRVGTTAPAHDWEVFVDAATGQVLQQRDALMRAEGQGQVFDPNPVVTTGDTTLRDDDDADSPELTGALFAVTLPRLDGSGLTRGAYADVRTLDASARLNAPDLVFDFTRGQSPQFEQVNAYYHLDRVQDRIQTDLGFVNVNNRAQEVIVDAFSDDNSYYSPQDLAMHFGTGGVDDAEDADILTHEYGHAVQDNQVPGFGGGDEGAMGEGFGDYLAGSMQMVLPAREGRPNQADPRCIGDWDSVEYSQSTPPCLRRLDASKHYPEAATGEVHDDGEMWSAALWRVRRLLGADVADTLVIEAHFLLSPSATFEQGAQAVRMADQNVFGGAHQDLLRRQFIAQGLSRALSTVDAGAVVASRAISVDNTRVGTLYADDLDDTQEVAVPGARALRIHFSRIETEADPQCLAGFCDNIYVFGASGDLFGVLNGVATDVTSAAVEGDTVRLRLVTDDSVGRFGYHADRVDVLGAIPDGGLDLDAGWVMAPEVDAGTPDAGVLDAGTPDAGVFDAGTFDAGIPDAGTFDAGTPDAGSPDAGALDAGGPRDAGPVDAGSNKTATPPPTPSASGCGCGATGPSGELWMGLWVMVGWVGGRRRGR